MKVDIKIPAMGESISEATIGTILKATGTKVAMDEEIVELETDKVNQVLFAPQAGILTLTVKPEDVVKIGQVIGYVDSEGQAAEAPKQEARKEEPPKKEHPKQETKKEEPPAPQPKKEEPPAPKPEPVKQSVSTGSSRLTKEDFAASLKAPAATESKQQPLKPATPDVKQESRPSQQSNRPESRKKMTKVRKVIAQRLVEVQQTTAMLTTFNEVDMSAVIAIRDKHKDQFLKEHGVKLGFMSFFVKAVVSALQAFPNVNGYIDGDEVVTREYYDIGIAVGTDKGLFVPVVRECNHLTFAGIEKAIETFAKKAREGGLVANDLQGGGFTITNGGTYGSLMSTPIINSPQSAILGMHKILKRPVAVGDEVVIRPMMYLALSYDHRLIDGKEAVSFLVHIKDFLEDPARLLLEQ